MSKVVTEAWVLPSVNRQPGQGSLVKESYEFDDISPTEVLAKPLYGCLEGNMLHAIERNPVDICAERGEDAVVLGNAGVVVVDRVGSEIKDVSEGDVCMIFGNGIWDQQGYPMKIMAFDAPGTMGVLAKSMKLQQRQLIRVPKGTPYSLRQWAAFSLRYNSAWANWRVAYACWQSQMQGVPDDEIVVCGWGGGVSYAQLTLAKQFGCKVIMACSKPERLVMLQEAGIDAIDRSQFDQDDFEEGFMGLISEKTGGRGVSIFIDNVGGPVHRLTLKSLARQGVITTCGWKQGMRTQIARAIECINRHIHVHTHFARYSEGLDAVKFAEEHAWIPPSDEKVWAWNEIPKLIEEYARGNVTSYFPIFAVNAGEE